MGGEVVVYVSMGAEAFINVAENVFSFRCLCPYAGKDGCPEL
jgi:hypothetical protein